MHEAIVEICSRVFVYPDGCPCCGEAADAELTVPVKISSRMMAEDTARRQLFPCCKRCVRHVAVREAGTTISILVAFAGTIGALSVGFVNASRSGLLVFGVAIVLALFLSALARLRGHELRRPACASVASPVSYYGWSGSTSAFSFASPTYTAEFAELNSKNLVSVDVPLRALLDAHRGAKARVPTTLAGTRVVPSRSVAEWRQYLEQQPSRIARRIALGHALAAVDNPAERDDLVAVVCSKEIAQLFDRLEGLSIRARTRQLRRAIANIRADNIPEELRDAELRELLRDSPSVRRAIA